MSKNLMLTLYLTVIKLVINISLEARVLQQLKFTIRFMSVALRFNFSQAGLIFMPNNSI